MKKQFKIYYLRNLLENSYYYFPTEPIDSFYLDSINLFKFSSTFDSELFPKINKKSFFYKIRIEQSVNAETVAILFQLLQSDASPKKSPI